MNLSLAKPWIDGKHVLQFGGLVGEPRMSRRFLGIKQEFHDVAAQLGDSVSRTNNPSAELCHS